MLIKLLAHTDHLLNTIITTNNLFKSIVSIPDTIFTNHGGTNWRLIMSKRKIKFSPLYFHVANIYNSK